MAGRFYVYELVDPRDDKVFYVGKGQRGRVHQHEVEARKGKVSAKCDLIRKIEADGLAIIKRKVSYFEDEIQAYKAETALILQYGIDHLTNAVLGGGGFSGFDVAEDRKVIASIANILRRVEGRDLTAVNILDVVTLDLRGAIEECRQCAWKIIGRRGAEWVNTIANPYNVNFVPT